MYAEHTPVHTIAQIVIALYFIWIRIKNIRLWDMNVQRIAVQNLPAVPCLLADRLRHSCQHAASPVLGNEGPDDTDLSFPANHE